MRKQADTNQTRNRARAINSTDRVSVLRPHPAQMEFCWPTSHFEHWRVGTYGFCMECGAAIEPQRLCQSNFALLCTGCEDVLIRTLLLYTVYGSRGFNDAN